MRPVSDNLDNGSRKVTELSHATVADGEWLNDYNIKPLSSRDAYLASAIDDISAAIVAGAGGKSNMNIKYAGTDISNIEISTYVNADEDNSVFNKYEYYSADNSEKYKTDYVLTGLPDGKGAYGINSAGLFQRVSAAVSNPLTGNGTEENPIGIAAMPANYLVDFNDSNSAVYCGWAGNPFSGVSPDGSQTISSVDDISGHISKYLVAAVKLSADEDSMSAIYKDVAASAVTVGSATEAGYAAKAAYSVDALRMNRYFTKHIFKRTSTTYPLAAQQNSLFYIKLSENDLYQRFYEFNIVSNAYDHCNFKILFEPAITKDDNDVYKFTNRTRIHIYGDYNNETLQNTYMKISRYNSGFFCIVLYIDTDDDENANKYVFWNYSSLRTYDKGYEPIPINNDDDERVTGGADSNNTIRFMSSNGILDAHVFIDERADYANTAGTANKLVDFNDSNLAVCCGWTGKSFSGVSPAGSRTISSVDDISGHISKYLVAAVKLSADEDSMSAIYKDVAAGDVTVGCATKANKLVDYNNSNSAVYCGFAGGDFAGVKPGGDGYIDASTSGNLTTVSSDFLIAAIGVSGCSEPASIFRPVHAASVKVGDADAVNGYKIVVTASLPSNYAADTLYVLI